MSLEPLTIHNGIAAAILKDNIDTDQIIPSREMKSVSKLGLSDGMFAGQRYLSPGSREENPDFVLNWADKREATILLSGKNFGCGSSREHAVWALHESGFRVLIAEGFGEIFYNNCIKNGILPVQTSAKNIASVAGFDGEVSVDLPAQEVRAGAHVFAFDIPAGDKRMLVEGLDSIALTELHNADIAAFFDADQSKRAWAY